MLAKLNRIEELRIELILRLLELTMTERRVKQRNTTLDMIINTYWNIVMGAFELKL